MTSRKKDAQSQSTETRETLGQVIRDLRESVGEQQGTFADRFSIGRTTITEIENHRASGEKLRAKLIEDFSAAKERIEAAADRWEARPRKQSGVEIVDSDSAVAVFRQEVESLTENGERLQAVDRLLGRFKDGTRGGFDSLTDRFWIAERLWQLYAESGQQTTQAKEYLTHAALDANIGPSMMDETVKRFVHVWCRELAGGRSAGDLHKLLDLTLAEYPDAPQLWLIKGEGLWIDQQYSSAYAALSTALAHHANRVEVLRVRSQVLAEWGSLDASLADIGEYFKCYSPPLKHRCEVLSAQAYAYVVQPFVEGYDPEKANELFLLAQRRGGNHLGLFHFRRGHFYESCAMESDALYAYKRALESKYPLDHVRAIQARERISVLTAKLDGE